LQIDLPRLDVGTCRRVSNPVVVGAIALPGQRLENVEQLTTGVPGHKEEGID
jgi:hypothetical protein